MFRRPMAGFTSSAKRIRPNGAPDRGRDLHSSIEVAGNYKTIQRLGVSIHYRRHAAQFLKPEQAVEYFVVLEKLLIYGRREVGVR